MSKYHTQKLYSCQGFTLIETIIYVALFSMLITGFLGSMGSFLSGAENTSAKVVVEGESAFAIRKINTILASSTKAIATSQSGDVLTVTENNNDKLIITTSGKAFTIQKTISGVTGAAVPFTADRVSVSAFNAKYVAATNGLPSFVEYSFTLGGVAYGPIRKYFTF